MRKGSKRIDDIYRVIKENPGLKTYQIGRKLGISRSAVENALPGLETNGYLTFEENDGRIYLFDIDELDNRFWL